MGLAPHFHFHFLGLTPAGSRQVKPMPRELLGLVPKPTDNTITVKTEFPDVEADTMPLIIDKVKRTLWQTKALAKKLKGSTTPETLKNDSDLILKYIKYKQDSPDHEQVRSPRRLLYEGSGDCDCFVVTLASLLQNQGIKFNFRIVKYNAGDDWSHIYVVVPKKSGISLSDRANYYVLDPVTNKHDYEVPFANKKDYDMSLQFLDGIPSGKKTLGSCSKDPDGLAFQKVVRRYVDTTQVMQQGLVPTRQFLQANKIPFQEAVDPKNNSGYFIVTTTKGTANVPTIISKSDAQALLDSATALQPPVQAIVVPPSQPSSLPAIAEPAQSQSISPVVSQAVAAGDQEGSFNWLKWGLIGIGVYALLKGRGPGLGGLKTVHQQKQKLKVVHI